MVLSSAGKKNEKPHLKRHTSRKKHCELLKRLTEWCKLSHRYRLKDLFRDLNAKVLVATSTMGSGRLSPREPLFPNGDARSGGTATHLRATQDEEGALEA